jgi:hypothetical protein
VSKAAGNKEGGKGPKKQERRGLYAAVALLALLAIIVPQLYMSQDVVDLDDRRTRLSRLTLPPDGSMLYNFLLREIPDIVSEIPCACCAMNLNACYRGGCPPA